MKTKCSKAQPIIVKDHILVFKYRLIVSVQLFSYYRDRTKSLCTNNTSQVSLLIYEQADLWLIVYGSLVPRIDYFRSTTGVLHFRHVKGFSDVTD